MSTMASWRLVPFLDHATRLIILQPVGGGWVFIHHLLQEHLAAKTADGPTPSRDHRPEG